MLATVSIEASGRFTQLCLLPAHPSIAVEPELGPALVHEAENLQSPGELGIPSSPDFAGTRDAGVLRPLSDGLLGGIGSSKL